MEKKYTKVMKIKITVTKEVLRQSMMCGIVDGKENTTNCAIALAVRDIFPNACVCHKQIFPLYNKLGGAFEIRLPQSAQRFIRVFDGLRATPKQRKGIQPISFEIDIPDGLIDHIDISNIENSKTLELQPLGI